MPHATVEKPDELFLVVVQTDQARSLDLGRRFPIYSNNFYIGNAEGADVLIGLGWAEPCRVHIFYENRTWHIHDLENFNHLSINGVSCAKFQIDDRDLIQIGEFVFELSMSGGIKFEFFEENEKTRQEDLLTKAYNRGYLYSVLEWEVNRLKHKATNHRRTSTPVTQAMSLIMLDIDHFGAFNKKYDHTIGDEVLKGVIERVKLRVRSTDLVARWGGEEFCIYLPETEKEKAMEVAEEVRKQVAETYFLIEQKKVGVTISLGVSEFEPEMDVDKFVQAASKKMLMAKEQGRNCVVG